MNETMEIPHNTFDEFENGFWKPHKYTSYLDEELVLGGGSRQLNMLSGNADLGRCTNLHANVDV